MPLSFLGFLAIGAAIGGMSGMFGIGGGAFLVPALVVLADSTRRRPGRRSGCFSPIGIAAFWQYYKADLVNVPAVLLLVAGFLPARTCPRGTRSDCLRSS